MKVVIIVASLFIGGSLYAQESSQREPVSIEDKAKHRTERISETITLTDAQKNQLTEVHLKEAKQREEIKNKALTEDQRNDELSKLRAEVDSQYKEILTVEQYEKLKSERARSRRANFQTNDKFQKLEHQRIPAEDIKK